MIEENDSEDDFSCLVSTAFSLGVDGHGGQTSVKFGGQI